jgi:hypothetical protein
MKWRLFQNYRRLKRSAGEAGGVKPSYPATPIGKKQPAFEQPAEAVQAELICKVF